MSINVTHYNLRYLFCTYNVNGARGASLVGFNVVLLKITYFDVNFVFFLWVGVLAIFKAEIGKFA